MQVETQKSARETRYKIAATDSYLASHVSYRTSKLANFPPLLSQTSPFTLANFPSFPSITISKLYSQSIWIEKVFTINAFYFASVCVQWVD